MRHRITYVSKDAERFELQQPNVTGPSSIEVTALHAIKEHRVTIDLSKIPYPLLDTFEECHKFHLRWAASASYESQTPFSARVSPGLHVFLTPRENSTLPILCSTLKTAFSQNIKCLGLYESFSSPSLLSTRFTNSPSRQFYTKLVSLANFVTFAQRNLCSNSDYSCQLLAGKLLTADYVDIDYDAISRSVVATAFWHKGLNDSPWSERIQQIPGDRVEVGVLGQEHARERDEVKLGGWLTVVGENKEPSRTLFSFPSRHHSFSRNEELQTSSSFTTSIGTPPGLHPNLHITLLNATSPNKFLSTCALHAYLTLPSYIFIDRYQFHDPLFLASRNIKSLRAVSGATDLEAPDSMIEQWGSSVLLELADPPNGFVSDWTATVPLHSRYLPPSVEAYFNAYIPTPAVFWACNSEGGGPSGSKMSVNPFDRINLGYDALFGDRTVFYHIAPRFDGSQIGGKDLGSSYSTDSMLEIPVLSLESASYIGPITLATVILGFVCVCGSLFFPLGLRHSKLS